MVTAKFGNKSFVVSKDKIYTPDGIKITESLNLEETEVGIEGVGVQKSKLTIKGINLRELTMSVKLDCRFVVVEEEIQIWKEKMQAHKSERLDVGVYPVGTMLLTQYSVSEIVIAGNGQYISATLDLTFKEDPAGRSYDLVVTENANAKKTVDSAKENPKAEKTVDSTTKAASTRPPVRIGSYVTPKKNTYWYETAEGALKVKGKRGKAYNKKMKVSYIYPKNTMFTKVKCVNPQGLGWLKIDDVTVNKY